MLKEVRVPDIGSFSNVEIIELLVKIGDTVLKDASLITLETDKATMEIPSPFGGVIKTIAINLGDKVSAGDLILTLETSESEGEGGSENKAESKTESKGNEKASAPTAPTTAMTTADKKDKEDKENKKEDRQESKEIKKEFTGEPPHAGPGVRQFSRELGVDLRQVSGTGRKNRILFTDVKEYVKNTLKRMQGMGDRSGTGIGGLNANIPPWPDIDHSQFGSITKEPLSRIKKLSGAYLLRNWLSVPHVTQFDEADITELEKFRKESQGLAPEGVKLTPLVFIMKAVTASLQAFPSFNASLDANGTDLILKHYFHIGVAVDTPNGLVVPVVREVDQKGLFQLAKELGEISQKARLGQLTAKDMQGSSFSISSLGGIGGTAFTPIINVPDVAILGVSKAQMKPIYQANADNEAPSFTPRLMLPLSLSYDHRVIDGAEAARFSTFLSRQLSDIRRLLL